MPFVVSASRTLNVSARRAFDALADHDAWSRWMPASFRPVGETVGRLAKGKTFRVRINGMPVAASCWISAFEDPKEITWSGGVKGLLRADHRFLFVAKGDAQVEVQSVETWHGVVARLLRRVIERDAMRVGNDQLDALAAAVSES
jgi:hypothetical protein